MRPPVVSFLYHDVCDDPSHSGFQRKSALPYKHGTREFRENLDVIAGTGNSPFIVTADGPSGPGLLLTFDDGGKSAMHIAEELQGRGWRGHFFVTTSMIGKRGFLSRADILDLHRRGHVMGCHSHTHPVPFNSLTFDEMVDEWSTSRRTLEDIVAKRVTTASVPGGDVSSDAIRAAAKSGIEYLFTSEPTSRPWSSHGITCLGRVCLKVGTPLGRVERLCRNRGLAREQAIRRIKNGVRFALGPIYVRWAKSRTRDGSS